MSYYADGLPGLMFHHSSHDLLLNDEGQKLSTLFLYGQTVRPIRIMTDGPFRSIVFHFFPHVIKTLFGIHAQELTDHCIDYKSLRIKYSSELEFRLRDETDVSSQLRQISDSLMPLVAASENVRHETVLIASKKILDSSGEVSLRSLQKELKITERSFERKFLQHVGVTPNLFRRICRFNSSLEELELRRFTNLTDLAHQQGFSDQSHFIRTFKEFTGLAPRQYLLESLHK